MLFRGRGNDHTALIDDKRACPPSTYVNAKKIHDPPRILELKAESGF
jgi:hypothetical protein